MLWWSSAPFSAQAPPPVGDTLTSQLRTTSHSKTIDTQGINIYWSSLLTAFRLYTTVKQSSSLGSYQLSVQLLIVSHHVASLRLVLSSSWSASEIIPEIKQWTVSGPPLPHPPAPPPPLRRPRWPGSRSRSGRRSCVSPGRTRPRRAVWLQRQEQQEGRELYRPERGRRADAALGHSRTSSYFTDASTDTSTSINTGHRLSWHDLVILLTLHVKEATNVCTTVCRSCSFISFICMC